MAPTGLNNLVKWHGRVGRRQCFSKIATSLTEAPTGSRETKAGGVSLVFILFRIFKKFQNVLHVL